MLHAAVVAGADLRLRGLLAIHLGLDGRSGHCVIPSDLQRISLRIHHTPNSSPIPVTRQHSILKIFS